MNDFTCDLRHHLLWDCLARHLEEGRGQEVALCSGDRTFSYGQLAAAAVAGAGAIDDRFAPGSRIVIASRTQLHVGVAFVAALQSRCVPLLADPTSAERLRSLAAEWQAAGAIVETALCSGLDVPAVPAAETERWLSASAPRRGLETQAVRAADPAFWTFTSGTTGEPRAVVHAHRGPRAAFETFARGVLRLGPEDVTIATAGLPFVYALGNNFLFPLMAGGTAVLPEDLLLPVVLGELVRHGASVLVSGPWSLAAIARLASRPAWVEALRRLRLVLSAGEPLPAGLFHAWQRRFGKELIDNFGCTEMFNSFLSNVPGDARPGVLGRAVPGFEVRVGGAPPRPGARGLLRVRGESRAIGMGERGGIREITENWCEPGDEVMVDGDGRFVFLGRRDDRFKVKGRFVYPLEIERRLLAVEGVAECMVCPGRDEQGIGVVVAKVVCEGSIDEGEIRRRLVAHARRTLQSFEMPARIEVVNALPRTPRGKLERPRRAAMEA